MPSSGEAQVSLVPYVHVDADLTDAAPGTVIELADEERHHLLRVLRLAEGDEVEVADGGGTSASRARRRQQPRRRRRGRP
jgi:16S rRNA U1498 N3-methylase RsmE